MDWEVEDRGERQRQRDRPRRCKGAKRLYPRHRPGPRGRGDLLACAGDAGRPRRAEGRRGPARHLQRDHQAGGARRASRHPRDLDTPLIDAYLARRALDYLVGFTLSPVLWRKLPGSRSAGRVQSVALRLICEREAEIEAFKAREYWTVEGRFATPQRRPLHRPADPSRRQEARPVRPAGRGQRHARQGARSRPAPSPSLSVEPSARSERNPPAALHHLDPAAGSLPQARLRRPARPCAPRSGSTRASISAARPSASSPTCAPTACRWRREAIAATATLIERQLRPRATCRQRRAIYQIKAKNAQEAHEAIRPTDVVRTPEEVARYLDERPAPALRADLEAHRREPDGIGRLDQTTRRHRRAPTKTMPARHRLGRRLRRLPEALPRGRGRRDAEPAPARSGRREDAIAAPAADAGARPARSAATSPPEQHFTQPPPRYTEASLVKKLEELGIGRPSTYASIICRCCRTATTCKLDKQRFMPEDRGRLVTAFLDQLLRALRRYDFTADSRSSSTTSPAARSTGSAVLRDFWQDFSAASTTPRTCDQGGARHAGRGAGAALLPDDGGRHRPARLPGLRHRPARPQARQVRRLHRLLELPGMPLHPPAGRRPAPRATTATSLGDGPARAGQPIRRAARPVDPAQGPLRPLCPARRGGRRQGEAAKPRRVSCPKGMDARRRSTSNGAGLLSLPRPSRPHPETASRSTAGIGRFGPYVKHGTHLSSRWTPADDVLSLGMNRAVELLAKAAGPRARCVERPHPADGAPVELHEGRYGPYVKHGKTIANAAARP